MGIQRRNPKLNFVASFGMIITAGTIYRFRGVFSRIFEINIKQILQNIGVLISLKSQKTLIPSQKLLIKGQWEKVLINKLQIASLKNTQRVIRTFDKTFFLYPQNKKYLKNNKSKSDNIL